MKIGSELIEKYQVAKKCCKKFKHVWIKKSVAGDKSPAEIAFYVSTRKSDKIARDMSPAEVAVYVSTQKSDKVARDKSPAEVAFYVTTRKKRQNRARFFSPLFTLSFLSRVARDFYVTVALGTRWPKIHLVLSYLRINSAIIINLRKLIYPRI